MRRRTKSTGAMVAAGLLLAGLAACSQAKPYGVDEGRRGTAPTSGSSGGVDVAILRGDGDGRLVPKDSPEALAEKMSTVVEGSIAGWADGASVVNYDERDYSAVLKIKVSRGFKGEVTKDADGGYVYVYFPRGGEVLAANGEPFRNPDAPSTVRSIDELNRAAPAGTRVIFFGTDPISLGEGFDDKQVRIENPGAGLPDGAPLLRAHAQGLLLDDNGQLASAVSDGEPWGWLADSVKPDDQFSQILDRLARRFPEARSYP